MLEGEDPAVYDDTGEVDDAVRGRKHLCAIAAGTRARTGTGRANGDVDAAMAGGIRGGRRDERTNDVMRAGHRPRPASPCHGAVASTHRRSERRGGDEESPQHPVHESMLVGAGAHGSPTARSVDNALDRGR